MTVRGHVPQRTCVGCGGKFAKGLLVRFTVLEREPGGIVAMDSSGSGEGRGVYVCSNPDCFDAAVKKNALVKRLRAAGVSPGLREDFERLLKGTE